MTVAVTPVSFFFACYDLSQSSFLTGMPQGLLLFCAKKFPGRSRGTEGRDLLRVVCGRSGRRHGTQGLRRLCGSSRSHGLLRQDAFGKAGAAGLAAQMSVDLHNVFQHEDEDHGAFIGDTADDRAQDHQQNAVQGRAAGGIPAGDLPEQHKEAAADTHKRGEHVEDLQQILHQKLTEIDDVVDLLEERREPGPFGSGHDADADIDGAGQRGKHTQQDTNTDVHKKPLSLYRRKAPFIDFSIGKAGTKVNFFCTEGFPFFRTVIQ